MYLYVLWFVWSSNHQLCHKGGSCVLACLPPCCTRRWKHVWQSFPGNTMKHAGCHKDLCKMPKRTLWQHPKRVSCGKCSSWYNTSGSSRKMASLQLFADNERQRSCSTSDIAQDIWRHIAIVPCWTSTTSKTMLCTFLVFAMRRPIQKRTQDNHGSWMCCHNWKLAQWILSNATYSIYLDLMNCNLHVTTPSSFVAHGRITALAEAAHAQVTPIW